MLVSRFASRSPVLRSDFRLFDTPSHCKVLSICVDMPYEWIRPDWQAWLFGLRPDKWRGQVAGHGLRR